MAGKIRVVHVIPRYFPVFGGAETQCRLLLKYLPRTDEVDIPFLVTGRIDRNSARMEIIDDILVYRLGISGTGRWQWYWFYLVSSLFLIRHRKSFDVIHCHATSVMGLAMTLTGKVLGKLVVLKLSSNGELLVGTGEMIRQGRLLRLRSRLRKAISSCMAHRACIVALNRQGSLEVAAAGARRPVVIPNGIDLEQYRPLDPESRARVRAEYGFGPADIVLLFVGRFVVGKGMNVLLSAFDLLVSDPRSERIHLCLAGGGALQVNAIQAPANSDTQNMRQRIHILPPKIPAVEYYQMTDLFVFPSQREGLPNVVLEALAVGLPCVLSDIDPHMELKQTNTDADIRLFATDDEHQLTLAIKTALDSLDSTDLPRTPTKCLSETYRIDNVARRYARLYREEIGAVG